MEFDYGGAGWKHLRLRALRRDGFMCQECKRYGRVRQATEVHHKKPVDSYPEFAFCLDNLVSLCHACHNKKHPEKALAMGRRYEAPHPQTRSVCELSTGEGPLFQAGEVFSRGG